jgi:hypothetical protein
MTTIILPLYRKIIAPCHSLATCSLADLLNFARSG